MKKIILFLMIVFSVSLFATDVSNFDIKGIKLGMSKDEVLKLMPKGTKFYVSDVVAYDSNYPYEYSAYFDWKKSNGRFSFVVTFDHQLLAYEINRNIRLKKNADIHRVTQQVINHYGKPDFVWKVNKHLYRLCWGKCKKGQYGFNTQKNGKTFNVEVDTYPNHLLYMILFDDKIDNVNREYKNHTKEEVVEKASKVDI